VIKKILILILSFSMFGHVYGGDNSPEFDPDKEFYDIFFGMLIEENNVLYFKKCAIVSPNMKIVDSQGNEDKTIRALYEKSKKEASVIQLATIANVKGVGKDDNIKYFINIKKVTDIKYGKSCMLLDDD
jgi:hypothetical protein